MINENNQSKVATEQKKKNLLMIVLISSNEDEIAVSLMFWESVQIYTLYHPSGGVALSNSHKHTGYESHREEKLSAYLLVTYPVIFKSSKARQGPEL